ncbi:hypothetical protein GCM10009504_08700 [Pseudomonas laurentiana]|uniref:Uncharacterized protein n=1 Tax=Pseudomonas laurentiana TaxID=2364649 RepID=A0A6I5RSS7_9PSED|nr:hypothetical protein [Pseudomonas laurentiana]NES10779.1 hypothetical protein [Pseudomonas laurentiana]GGU54048.1 hypothetical protein GCM10009504_08700 [Pseudomonas laurentiana]
MAIHKVVGIGLAGNEISKQITGSDEVSAGRTVVAAGSGAAIGAVAAGTLAIGATAVGIATAPITVPLAVGGAIIAGIASLFD